VWKKGTGLQQNCCKVSDYQLGPAVKKNPIKIYTVSWNWIQSSTQSCCQPRKYFLKLSVSARHGDDAETHNFFFYTVFNWSVARTEAQPLPVTMSPISVASVVLQIRWHQSSKNTGKNPSQPTRVLPLITVKLTLYAIPGVCAVSSPSLLTKSVTE